jgi:hypothetical protein
VEGGTEPSAVENFQKGNYGTAALQGLGAMGDLAMAVPVAGAAIGSVMKAPRTAQRILSSSTTAKDDLAKLLGYSEDIPNEKWLAGKVEDAVSGGTNSFGVPRRMGSTTGYFGKPVEVPVEVLAKLPGERGEQGNVRKDSLDYIRKNWDTVSKEAPYIEVDPFGKAWVSEGNHRIMVAKEKGLKTLPVEIRYFSGGQRNAGELAPEKILEYNLPSTTTAKDDLAKMPGVLPKAERDANLNKMLENSVVKEPVYHSTYSDFPEFKTNFGEDEYFQFGAHVGSVDAASNRLSLKQAEDAARGAKGSESGANIMPVYAKITNPLRLDENRTGRWGVDDIMSTIMEKADSGDIKGIPPNIVDDFFDDNLQIEKFLGKKVKGEPRVWQNTMDWKPGERSKLLTEFIEKLGHDGIVYNNLFEGGGDSYLVLRPTQLKSATGNKGTYDTENPVLNKAKGGEVRKPK